MPFNLDIVHVPIIKKTHLFIPKEFIVKIRKTKRKGKYLPNYKMKKYYCNVIAKNGV